MIAFLIKIGYYFFPNEFGVRLLTAILSTITIWFIEGLLTIKDHVLFYTIVLSIATLQIGGITAAPDIPLMFFTALFFLLYKQFIQHRTILTTIALGICMALMLYSKYHGILVILFTLLSNFKLLRYQQTYIACALGLVLYLPHLYWQYDHNFPSLQFHLFERHILPYKLSDTLNYLIGELLLAGPLAGFILLWCAFRKKPMNEVERALKFCMVGFYLFFLLATIQRGVEINWTIPALVGVIVLGHQYVLYKMNVRRWIFMLSIATLIIVTAFRVFVIFDFLPTRRMKTSEVHHNRSWAMAIHQKASGLPVFFTDSYSRASKYWFYTGIPAFSLNTLAYRRNNYNFWPVDENLMNKKAYGVYQGGQEYYYTDTILTKKGIYLGRRIEPYFSFSQVMVLCDKPVKAINNVAHATFDFHLDDFSLRRIHPPYDTASVVLGVYEKDKIIRIIPTGIQVADIAKNPKNQTASFPINLPKGEYKARFGITSCIRDWPTINSSIIKLIVQ